MVTIRKIKPGDKTYQDYAGTAPAQSPSSCSARKVTITKIHQEAKPVVPVSNPTATAANKTGSAYAPRSTSQWREVGGGRVSTTPAETGVNRRVNAKSSRVEQKGHTIVKRDDTPASRIWNTLKSGFLSELSNQANNLGVGYDARGGSTMAAGVYKDQALMLQQQVDAAQAGLRDPNLSAMDRADLEWALKQGQEQLAVIQKAIGAEKQVAPAMYHASDTAASKAEAAKAVASSGLGKVGRAAVDIGAGLTGFAIQQSTDKFLPGSSTVARASSISGQYSRAYRQNAGNEYDSQKALRAGSIAGAGVVAGAALSSAVSAAGLNVLKAFSKQNSIPANILKDGTSGAAYMLGEAGAAEASNYATYEGYHTDPKQFAENMAWAFAFGAIHSAIRTVSTSAQNKAYAQKLNEQVSQRYEMVRDIMKTGTPEQKVQGASSVMDGVEKLRAALNDMQFIGAQKQVDSIHQFLNSIDAEMAQYIPMAAHGSLVTAPVPAPAAPRPTAGEMIPESAKPTIAPSIGTPEFTPEEYANIEAEPSKVYAEGVEPQDTTPLNDNPAALVPAANTLGQSGKKAMLAFYDGDVDTDLYAKDFVTAYNAGLNGKTRPTENYISVGKAVAAYTAGQNDAKAKTAAVEEAEMARTNYDPLEVSAIRHEGKTFRNLVAGFDTSVSQFFNRWRNGRKSHQEEKLEKLYLGKLTESSKSQVSNILGYPVARRNVIITSDDVKHIFDHHGDAESEARHGNLPIEQWAVEALPEIVTNPDSITPGETKKSGKNPGKQGIIFNKALQNGRVVTVQFDNSSRGTMEITTMYVKENSGNPTQALNVENHSPQLTSKTPPDPVVSANINIPPSHGNIKGDILSDLATGKKRVDQKKLTSAEFETAADHGMYIDAEGKVYHPIPTDHIDRRTIETAGNRDINAFQFDHPELHGYYKKAAANLIADADISMQFPMPRRTEHTVNGKRTIQSAIDSGSLRSAMDMGLSRNQIIDAAQSLVIDHGQENYAAAKRLELVLDDMLTNGYTTVFGDTVEPNSAYISAKAEIVGSKPQQRKSTIPDELDAIPEDKETTTPSSLDHMVAAESPEQRWSAQRVGDTEKAPMPVSDIVEKIRHDFGINITTGHVRGAGIAGQYDRESQGIRSRIVNDLPTVSHELGHHLDNLYGLTKDLPEAAHRELIDGLDAEMKAAYKEKKWLTEGLAEYTRKYLQNRETASIDYPEFTKHFKSTLNAKDNALIDQLADEVNAYYSMDAETAGSSIRNREDRGRDFRTWDQRVAEKGDAFYQAWVDSNHGIRLFDRATGSQTYKLASNAAYADATAGSILTGDLTGPEGQYVASGLTTALHGVDLKNKTEYRDFGEYLVVKHGPERLKEGMRIFADDRKNSTAWMEDRAQALEQQYPEFKAAATRLYQFQTDFLQTWGVGSGLVSAQSAKNWAERWKYYVPLNRFMGDRGVRGAKRGFANQNSTIRKAYGSGRDIVNPVDNIIDNVVRMVNAATRNNVAAQITKVAQSRGGMADFLEKVPAPLKQKTFDATVLKGKLSDALDEGMMQGTIHADDASFAQDMIDGIDDLLIQYGRGIAHGDVVTVLRNGKPEYWKINDPFLLSSLTSMDVAKLPAWVETYGAVSRFVTSNITGNNVIWSVFSNFPRDLMTYFTFSQDKNPVHMMGGIASAYANRLKGKNADPLYKEYLAMGGGKVSAYSADRDLAKNIRAKLIGGKAQWLNPVEWICFVSDTVEMGPRYSYYKICREMLGMTPQEAFYESCDITVNFRRGGVQGRTINKVIPFFNAGVQGMDKYVRWQTCEEIPYSITSKERSKAIRSRMIAYLTASAALAALFYGMNSKTQEDQDNYAQLSNYTKNNYWCIPLGGGKYFTIPKPREITVPSSFVEAAAEKYLNGNPHAMDEFYNYTADTCLPNVASDVAQADIGGAIGNLGVLGTGVRMFANKDFLGKPIVSSGMQNLEPKDQYNNRTSKLAKAVGDAFNVSPMMTDYFFSNTLGGWWKYQKALFPVGGENVDLTLGVQGSYVRDNQYSTDLVNWLYDQAEASSKHKNSNPEDMEAAIQYKRDSSMTSFYSNFNKLSKSAPETGSRRATRQAVLSMITEYRKDFDNGTRTEAEAAVEAVCEAAGSTEYLPSVMPVTVKDANGEAHTLSDAQYLEYQTEYLGFYWDIVEDTLERAGNQQSKEAALTAAKSVAKDNATRRLFSRMGIKAKPDKYKGISGSALTQFKAGIDKANDDGSLTQDEVIDIIDQLNGLSDDQRSTLFQSHYESDKNNPWA